MMPTAFNPSLRLGSKIVGTGAYLPQKILTNKDLESMVDTSEDWIVERSGIKSRHIADKNELTSDLGAKALAVALEKADKTADWLDGIIVATTTADNIFPSTAAIIQHKAGLKPGFALDVNAVCAGFVYAFCIADSLIKSGVMKRVAVIGAETMSRIVDWSDRSTCVLFGDGAGAVILEATEEDVMWESSLSCDGSLHNILHIPGGISSGYNQEKIQMHGKEVFRHGIEKMVLSSQQALSKANITADEVDILVPHQANIRMLAMVADKLGIPENKIAICLESQGNTSAATIPMALHAMVESNRIKRGMKVLMTAAGAGFAWGSVLFSY